MGVFNDPGQVGHHRAASGQSRWLSSAVRSSWTCCGARSWSVARGSVWGRGRSRRRTGRRSRAARAARRRARRGGERVAAVGVAVAADEAAHRAAVTLVGRVGDRAALAQHRLVVGHDLLVAGDHDPVRGGDDVDEPADRARVDRVVVAVDPHVVVAGQPDPVRSARPSGATGGSVDHRRRRSVASARPGGPDRAQVRVLAVPVSQSWIWALKSNGEVNVRPGRNEVSKYPLRRSTSPLNSGSRGGASLIRTPSVPANAAASTLELARSRRSRTPGPTPACAGQPPHPPISSHIPARMSPALRDGIITASVTREYPHVIASTGNTRSCPRGAAPGSAPAGTTDRTARPRPARTPPGRPGRAARYNGRSCRTRSLRIVNDCVQPIRSAITVAGIRGNSASNARICGSTASTTDPRGARSRRRRIRPQRRPHRVPRQPQPPSDLLDRHTLRPVQPTDLSPVLHRDHPSSLTEGSVPTRR